MIAGLMGRRCWQGYVIETIRRSSDAARFRGSMRSKRTSIGSARSRSRSNSCDSYQQNVFVVITKLERRGRRGRAVVKKDKRKSRMSGGNYNL